jgi:ABC-type nitrate/sulfonate/bicarbonate transport system permease component
MMGFIIGLFLGFIIGICIPQNLITEFIRNKVFELIDKIKAKYDK